MKHSITILFLLFAGITQCLSQEKLLRIAEIKKWYAEIIQLNNTSKSKQCKKGKMIEYSMANDSKKYPFEQTAEFCQISKEYSTYHAKFQGHEWSCETAFYLKDNTFFFVLMPCGAEGSADEYRIYYDDKGKIIKILNNTNEESGSENLKSVEITDKTEIKRITDDVNTDFKKVLKILNHK